MDWNNIALNYFTGQAIFLHLVLYIKYFPEGGIAIPMADAFGTRPFLRPKGDKG